MDELHIDDFYKDCAVVLLRLYRSFPRKTSIYVGDLCGYEETDEIGLYSDRFQACFAAIMWLAEEGHIRYAGTIGQEAIELATLSQKSFTLLSNKPVEYSNNDQHEESPTLAKQIHRAITQGTSNQVSYLISQLLSQTVVH